MFIKKRSTKVDRQQSLKMIYESWPKNGRQKLNKKVVDKNWPKNGWQKLANNSHSKVDFGGWPVAIIKKLYTKNDHQQLIKKCCRKTMIRDSATTSNNDQWCTDDNYQKMVIKNVVESCLATIVRKWSSKNDDKRM